jgi:hypothetical protein
MMTENIKLKQGEAVREFYSSLPVIEEYYSVKGYRKITYLFEVLHEKLGWKMSLRTFRYHINKHLVDGIFVINPGVVRKKEVSQQQLHIDTLKKEPESIESYTTDSVIVTKEKNGPVIARPNFPKAPKFNPHTVDIDPSRII